MHQPHCSASQGSPPRVWGRHNSPAYQNQAPRFTPTCVGTTRCSARRSTGRPVHPHVCGDDGDRGGRHRNDPGSPPRVWGRQSGARPGGWSRRFTPTCVGTTASICVTHRCATVHPHVCGDDQAPGVDIERVVGSPPRVWGRLTAQAEAINSKRFTPTCVGTTCAVTSATSASQVHPHVCGDDYNSGIHEKGRSGSPPRVWGRPLVGRRFRGRCRFTPTCVGTTDQPRRARASSTVHPHVCGDDCNLNEWWRLSAGSPPRVWGRQPTMALAAFLSWFTPTCVGTTVRPPCSANRSTVHPHVCGDDLSAPARVRVQPGSPPRVWGRRAAGHPRVRPRRFTPTCVGTTQYPCKRHHSQTVHPHVCGDDTHAACSLCQHTGSPPRVWGRPIL